MDDEAAQLTIFYIHPPIISSVSAIWPPICSSGVGAPICCRAHGMIGSSGNSGAPAKAWLRSASMTFCTSMYYDSSLISSGHAFSCQRPNRVLFNHGHNIVKRRVDAQCNALTSCRIAQRMAAHTVGSQEQLLDSHNAGHLRFSRSMAAAIGSKEVLPPVSSSIPQCMTFDTISESPSLTYGLLSSCRPESMPRMWLVSSAFACASYFL